MFDLGFPFTEAKNGGCFLAPVYRPMWQEYTVACTTWASPDILISKWERINIVYKGHGISGQVYNILETAKNIKPTQFRFHFNTLRVLLHILWYLKRSDYVNSLRFKCRFKWNFRQVIFSIISVVGALGISCELVLRWMPLKLTDDKSTLVHVMAWCYQAPSHYLNQCWPSSLMPWGVTRPQCHKTIH